MSKEDWESFKELEKERQRKRADRRKAFAPAEGSGWHKFSDTHWRYSLNGKPIDYWPGPMKWQYLGKIHYGDVQQFIAKRERVN